MSSVLTNPKPLTLHKNELLRKPTFLQLRVDEIWLGHSESGNLWQAQETDPLTPDRLIKVLQDPLFTEVRVVELVSGEPGDGPGVVAQVRGLVTGLPNLARLELVTPAATANREIDSILQIGSIAQAQGVRFSVRLGLSVLQQSVPALVYADGSCPPQMQALVRLINTLQNRDEIAVVRLECRVNPHTVDRLHDWLEFALAQHLPIVYTLDAVPQTITSGQSSMVTALDFEARYHLAIFLENLIGTYETSESQVQYYRSLIGQLMYDEPRRVGCAWQSGGVTLAANGDLLYCAVQSRALGSALESSAASLYEQNQEHFTAIRQSKCASCTQGCLPPISEPASGVGSPSLFQRLAPSLKTAKSLKLFQPLKTLKGQLAFQRSLKALGVTQDNLSLPRPALTLPTPQTGRRKVLICGWYGTETLGDKAILGGVVQALRETLGEVELHLVALELYISQMTIRQMPELQDCTLHSVADALDRVDGMDLVVFGGGPLMAIGTMAEMLAIFQRAVAAQIPTLLAGCGVGPLGAGFFNDAIKQVLLHSSYRIYRDQKSLEIAQSLGVDVSQDQVAEDPAFTWLASRTQGDQPPDRGPGPALPRLLLGLRDWPYHEFAAEKGALEAERLKHRFEAEIIAGLEGLVERYPNLTIVPFPMCTNHLGFDDRWFYRRLFRDRPKLKDALDFSYLGAELRPDDAVAVFQSATAALTMRFHSLVFALSTGLPAVAVDYTLGRGKVKSLAERFHIPYMGLDTITSEFLASSLSQLFAGELRDSSTTFQAQRLRFKDSIKDAVKLLSQS